VESRLCLKLDKLPILGFGVLLMCSLYMYMGQPLINLYFGCAFMIGCARTSLTMLLGFQVQHKISDCRWMASVGHTCKRRVSNAILFSRATEFLFLFVDSGDE